MFKKQKKPKGRENHTNSKKIKMQAKLFFLSFVDLISTAFQQFSLQTVKYIICINLIFYLKQNIYNMSRRICTGVNIYLYINRQSLKNKSVSKHWLGKWVRNYSDVNIRNVQMIEDWNKKNCFWRSCHNYQYKFKFLSHWWNKD